MTIEVKPTEYGVVFRGLKRTRTAEEVVATFRKWYERRIDRIPDCVYQAEPNFFWEHDPSTRRHIAYFHWYYSRLPAGLGKHVFK